MELNFSYVDNLLAYSATILAHQVKFYIVFALCGTISVRSVP